MTDEDLTTIRADQYYPHSPARVWQVLTTPSMMAIWLMANDFQPVLGHHFTLHGSPIEPINFSGIVACEVLDIREAERLRISWRDANNPESLDSTVTWELHPEGHGTRLILEHSGFDPEDPDQQMSRRIMNGGWRSRVLRRFSELLAESDQSASMPAEPGSLPSL